MSYACDMYVYPLIDSYALSYVGAEVARSPLITALGRTCLFYVCLRAVDAGNVVNYTWFFKLGDWVFRAY